VHVLGLGAALLWLRHTIAGPPATGGLLLLLLLLLIGAADTYLTHTLPSHHTCYHPLTAPQHATAPHPHSCHGNQDG